MEFVIKVSDADGEGYYAKCAELIAIIQDKFARFDRTVRLVKKSTFNSGIPEKEIEVWSIETKAEINNTSTEVK